MKIAIVGTGSVGTSLGSALIEKRYEIVYGSRDPASTSVSNGAQVRSQSEAVKDADVIIMAVPYLALQDTVMGIGPDAFAGKTVIDVTNVLGSDREWALGFDTSGAEELAKAIPKAKVVKAFNTVFAKEMRTGNLNGERLTLLIAGDDRDAKDVVRNMGESIGFDVVDAGALRSARMLEALGVLSMHLAYNQKLSPEIGVRIVKG